jgi:type I restriction enzyme S subunit
MEPFLDMPLVAPNHIEKGTGRLLAVETARDQGAESGKYLVRPGQVVYSKIRPSLAKATMVGFSCLCSADMYALQGKPGVVLNSYLMWILLSRAFTDIVVDQSARVAMPKVNQESLGAAPIWYPSVQEQEAIVAYLQKETGEIDRSIADVRASIALSKERRAALISAAVTGKIDVREHSGVKR